LRKGSSGHVHQEGKIGSTRRELDAWIQTLPQPWMMAMEATIFTGWIYDHLLPHAEKVKVAHPLMLRAIAAAKKKNDRIELARLPTARGATFWPSAIWLRRRFEIGEGSHQLLLSADKVMCMPISKQRNKHIQHVLVEAAKLAPRYSHELALLREKEIQRGNKNRATLAVARKLVAYMLAVDRRKQDFVPAEELAAKAVA
jgi:hypothetical protein